MDEDWRALLVEDPSAIRALARASKRVAVLGIKTEKQASQPAFYVAKYLQDAGVEVIPVPVYFAETDEILGEAVYRKLRDVPGTIDLVDVFRRSEDVAAHLDDILAAKPKAVWMQLGIRNDQVAEVLARAGIAVVQDRCLMVDHRAAAIG